MATVKSAFNLIPVVTNAELPEVSEIDLQKAYASIKLIREDAAPNLTVYASGQTVRGSAGFRSIRASHGIKSGSFYYEVLWHPLPSLFGQSIAKNPANEDITPDDFIPMSSSSTMPALISTTNSLAYPSSQTKVPIETEVRTDTLPDTARVAHDLGTIPQQSPHIRVGFSTLQTTLSNPMGYPVGYDANSFGFRDATGDNVCQSFSESYGSTFKPGDIIGCFVHISEQTGGSFDPSVLVIDDRTRSYSKRLGLPGKYSNYSNLNNQNNNNMAASTAQNASNDTQSGITGSPFHKRRGAAAANANSSSSTSSSGASTSSTNNDLVSEQIHRFQYRYSHVASKSESFIEFFINGVSQGVAFTDLPYQEFYPVISLFQHATVTVNFGPDFAYPPRQYCQQRDVVVPLDIPTTIHPNDPFERILRIDAVYRTLFSPPASLHEFHKLWTHHVKSIRSQLQLHDRYLSTSGDTQLPTVQPSVSVSANVGSTTSGGRSRASAGKFAKKVVDPPFTLSNNAKPVGRRGRKPKLAITPQNDPISTTAVDMGADMGTESPHGELRFDMDGNTTMGESVGTTPQLESHPSFTPFEHLPGSASAALTGGDLTAELSTTEGAGLTPSLSTMTSPSFSEQQQQQSETPSSQVSAMMKIRHLRCWWSFERALYATAIGYSSSLASDLLWFRPGSGTSPMTVIPALSWHFLSTFFLPISSTSAYSLRISSYLELEKQLLAQRAVFTFLSQIHTILSNQSGGHIKLNVRDKDHNNDVINGHDGEIVSSIPIFGPLPRNVPRPASFLPNPSELPSYQTDPFHNIPASFNTHQTDFPYNYDPANFPHIPSMIASLNSQHSTDVFSLANHLSIPSNDKRRLKPQSAFDDQFSGLTPESFSQSSFKQIQLLLPPNLRAFCRSVAHPAYKTVTRWRLCALPNFALNPSYHHNYDDVLTSPCTNLNDFNVQNNFRRSVDYLRAHSSLLGSLRQEFMRHVKVARWNQFTGLFQPRLSKSIDNTSTDLLASSSSSPSDLTTSTTSTTSTTTTSTTTTMSPHHTSTTTPTTSTSTSSSSLSPTHSIAALSHISSTVMTQVVSRQMARIFNNVQSSSRSGLNANSTSSTATTTPTASITALAGANLGFSAASFADFPYLSPPSCALAVQSSSREYIASDDDIVHYPNAMISHEQSGNSSSSLSEQLQPPQLDLSTFLARTLPSKFIYIYTHITPQQQKRITSAIRTQKLALRRAQQQQQQEQQQQPSSDTPSDTTTLTPISSNTSSIIAESQSIHLPTSLTIFTPQRTVSSNTTAEQNMTDSDSEHSLIEPPHEQFENLYKALRCSLLYFPPGRTASTVAIMFRISLNATKLLNAQNVVEHMTAYEFQLTNALRRQVQYAIQYVLTNESLQSAQKLTVTLPKRHQGVHMYDPRLASPDMMHATSVNNVIGLYPPNRPILHRHFVPSESATQTVIQSVEQPCMTDSILAATNQSNEDHIFS